RRRPLRPVSQAPARFHRRRSGEPPDGQGRGVMVTTSQVSVSPPAVFGPFFRRNYGLIVSTTAVVLFLILWEVASTVGWVNVRFISKPSLVAVAAVDVFINDNFLYHSWISFAEFALGFAMSLVVGIPLGLMLGA